MGLKSARGFTLLEVLMSLLLLSLIVFALDGVEILALRRCKASYLYAVAQNQFKNLITQLHTANPQFLTENLFNNWNNENQQLLPNSLSKISGVFPNLTIELLWGDHQCNDLTGFSECIKEEVVLRV
jgi:prepilin-type N-terminal cleavage/methylation domain-containing protein